MSTSIQINTTNFFGQEADIMFYPCSGGTINLGLQILPYTYVTLDDNYSGTYYLSFTALSATCDFSIPCGSPPIVDFCYPMFSTSANTMYYFDFPNITENYYYNFSHPICAITRDDIYLWVYDGSSIIYEYDVGTMTPPALLRQINTTTNSVDIYGLFPYTSTTKLVATNTTNDVYVIDISTITASKTTLFSHSGSNQPCNILRDNNLGVTYLKDGSNIKSYYDDGTLYSTSTPTGDTRGIFRDPSNAKIYVINSSGETYNIPQSSGTVTPTYFSTIPLSVDLNIGVAQSSSCISPVTSFKLTSIGGLTGNTDITITANTGSFHWIDWGDYGYYANAEGSMTKTFTYPISPIYSGDITVYSYTNFSGLTGLDPRGTPTSCCWPFGTYGVGPATNNNLGRFFISEMNKITGLEFYQTGTVFSQFQPVGNWALFPSNMVHIDNAINPDYFPTTVLSSGYTTDLPSNLQFFRWNGGAGYGNVNGLPINLEYLQLRGNYFTGNVSGLPQNLEYLYLSGNDTLSGDTSGLPPTLDYIFLFSSLNTISGNVSGLPKIFSNSYAPNGVILIRGFNTISGDTGGFSGSYPKTLWIEGYNTISGSLSGIPNTVTSLLIGGLNTISGCLSALTLTGTSISIDISGDNTISCDGTGIPSGVTALNITGDNLLTGDISSYSGTSLRSLRIFGSNTISGDTSSVYSGLTSLNILGFNTIDGDIANLPNATLPAPNTRSFQIYGLNTMYGDIGNLPSTYTDFRAGGYNTVSGDVANIPNQVIYLDIGGNNTIGGPLSGLSSTNLRTFILSSTATTVTGPVVGLSLPSNYVTFLYNPFSPAVGLTQTDVDDVLCYFTGLTMSPGKQIRLLGTNAAPSSTGLACKAILTGNSVTVLTN